MGTASPHVLAYSVFVGQELYTCMLYSGQDTFLLDVLGAPWSGSRGSLFVMHRLKENAGPEREACRPLLGAHTRPLCSMARPRSAIPLTVGLGFQVPPGF